VINYTKIGGFKQGDASPINMVSQELNKKEGFKGKLKRLQRSGDLPMNSQETLCPHLAFQAGTESKPERDALFTGLRH